MRTLSKKICPQCCIEFEFESWNKKKVYCSKICKDIASKGSRITTQEWITKAKEKHGDRYLYDLVDINNKENGKIKIICNVHGVFLQNPSQHLIGKGCKKCANDSQFMTTEEFKNKANKIHDNKYDYSLTKYSTTKNHVCIICPLHGPFYQSPNQHLYQHAGCHTCAQIYTISRGEKQWLTALGIPDNTINRQVPIYLNNRKYIVDGLLENTVYEYLGDFWHGNPDIYSKTDINILAKKSFGDLYSETLSRFDILKNAGYNLIYIWESEWQKK